jgi:hypothetical protein
MSVFNKKAFVYLISHITPIRIRWRGGHLAWKLYKRSPLLPSPKFEPDTEKNQTEAHPEGRAPPNPRNHPHPPQQRNPETQQQTEAPCPTLPDPTSLQVPATGPLQRVPLPDQQARVLEY